jgi:hypothetical protein
MALVRIVDITKAGQAALFHRTMAAPLMPSKPRSASAKPRVPKLKEATRKSQRADELLKNSGLGEKGERRSGMKGVKL